MSEVKDKPSLLVLASTYPRWEGDPEPGFVHELARRLTGEFRVRVLCPHAAGAKRLEQMDGVSVARFRYAPERLQTLVNDGGMVANLRKAPWKLLLLPAYALAIAWAIRRELARHRPDAVHAHWLIPQGLVYLIASIGRRRPFLVTSHGADLFALRGSFFSYCRRVVCSRAGWVTVVSPTMKERLVSEGVAPERIVVASMGVDFQARFVPTSSVARVDNELLFVGRLVEKKGLRVLLDAMPAIAESCPTVSLTVVGFGPEESALRQQAQLLGLGGRVDFIGAVPQAGLPDLYRRAALFVAPFVEAASGDQEGLGLVALEAAGCGCLVVISDLPATREVFLDRVIPGSSAALAVAVIEQLSATPESRAARAAAQRARLASNYDWQPVAQAYSGLIHSMLQTSHARR